MIRRKSQKMENEELTSFEKCLSSENLADCYKQATLIMYNDAGLDINNLVQDPPFRNPLAEHYDYLGPLFPMMIANRVAPENSLFLDRIRVDPNFLPNYEPIYFETLKTHHHRLYEDIQKEAEDQYYFENYFKDNWWSLYDD